jgi:hypothetical protein
MKMEVEACVNLRENCWATGHNMAAERPQGIGTRAYMEEAFRHNTIKRNVCYILDIILI